MADVSVSVFISYSRVDSGFIDRLEADLRAYGFDTWVDRQHLEGGADWARLIEQEILKREVLVVALSPDAVTSTWVRREITFALSAGRHIVPIIVRPVERVPIEIIEKQYIDLSADYAGGVQELRVALLKTRALPQPPQAIRTPQPLLAIPDVSDPLKDLVKIPPPPPLPNPDLNATFMQAQTSLAHGNLDLAEALFRQVVEQQSDFGYGLAAEELERVRGQLAPKQIERLRTLADEAHARGAWGQAVGALRALKERLPHDRDLAVRLSQAEGCQRWAWLYDNARAFSQAGDADATRIALNQLWDKAPYFGDPSHIAPHGMTPPTEHTREATVKPKYASLVVEIGNDPTAHSIASTPFTIGRSRNASLSLSDLAVSFLHATIICDDQGQFGVRDEQSANGTFVNERRISVQWLQDGDRIQVGQTILRFQLPSTEGPN